RAAPPGRLSSSLPLFASSLVREPHCRGPPADRSRRERDSCAHNIATARADCMENLGNLENFGGFATARRLTDLREPVACLLHYPLLGPLFLTSDLSFRAVFPCIRAGKSPVFLSLPLDSLPPPFLNL